MSLDLPTYSAHYVANAGRKQITYDYGPFEDHVNPADHIDAVEGAGMSISEDEDKNNHVYERYQPPSTSHAKSLAEISGTLKKSGVGHKPIV